MSFAKWSAPLAALALLSLVSACSKPEASFARDVMPTLQKNCSSCHSAGGKGYLASGFSVDSYASIMKGTKFGPVVMPGSSASSTLDRLIEHKADPSINMPQGQAQLPQESRDRIAAWIDQGAKDN